MSEPDLSGLGANEARMWRQLFADLRPGDVFLDIGAECGHWTVPAAVAGATVCAFEAGNAEFVREAASAAGVSGRVTVVRATVLDGATGPHRAHPNYEPVPATSVDEFVRAAGLDRVDFVKIDIEGYEVRALDGARGTLARFRPALMVEVHYDGGWNGVPVSVADVAARLVPLGYVVEATDYAATVGWGGAHVLARHPGDGNADTLERAV